MRFGLGFGLNKGGALQALYRILMKTCGLLSYSKGVTDGIMYDKTGQTRPAVQELKLTGDTVQYLKFATLPNQAFSYTDATTKLTVNTALDANGEWIFTTNGAYEVIFVISGDTYKLNISGIDEDDGIIQLVDVATNETIDGQLFLATNPTEVTNEAVSLADEYGFTVSKARGKNLFDKDSTIVNTYIDVNGVRQPSGSGLRASEFIKLNQFTNYKFSGITIFSQYLAYYDKDKNFISSQSVSSAVLSGVNTPSDCEYLSFTFNPAEEDTIQLELGSVATAYEPYDGYYRDQALTDPISQGTIIPTGTDGYALAYVTGGVRPIADYRDKVGLDVRIVDGVADSGENNSNWEFAGAGTGTDGFNITIVDDSGTDRAKLYMMKLEPSTQYTLVYNVSENNSSNLVIFGTESDIDLTTGLTENIGENRFLITTSTNIVFNGFSFLVTSGSIIFDSFRVYEGDYVTGSPPLPTSQQAVVGNSWIWNDLYNDVFTTDTPENTVDKANNQNKVIPFAEANIKSDQVFVNLDTPAIAYTETSLEEPCYTKTLQLMKLNEGLFDVNGDPLYDIDGSRLYALADGVTREV